MRDVRAQLTRLLTDRIPITILRRKLGKRVETLEGVVVVVGNHWVVIAKLIDYAPDGWEVIRMRDISKIRVPDPDQLDFEKRVMAGDGAPIEAPPNLRLPGDLHWRDELIFILSTDSLLGVFEERHHPDAMRIGVYTGTNRKWFRVRQIGASGHWDVEHTLIKLSETTRIVIGGRYQSALSRYGDPVPSDL